LTASQLRKVWQKGGHTRCQLYIGLVGLFRLMGL
jgi:hypothetical protein